MSEPIHIIAALFALLAAGIAATAMAYIRHIVKKYKAIIDRQQKIYDASPIISSLWDAEHTILDCNATMVELLELSGKEDYIHGFSKLAPPLQPCGTPSAQYLANSIEKARELGSYRFLWTHLNAQGQPVPGEVTFVRIDLERGHMFAAFMLDMREITAAWEAERKATELTQLLLNNSPYFMEMWDAHHNLIDCNEKMLKVLGCASKAEFTRRFYEFSAPIQPGGTPVETLNTQMLGRAMQHGYARSDWTFLLPDGAELPADTTWIRATHRGQPIIIVYSHDLRPLRAADAKTNEALNMAQLLLDTSPLFIEIWDADLNIINCNQTMLDVFGCATLEEYVYRYSDFNPVFQPCGRKTEDVAAEGIAQVVKHGRARFEWMHILPNGDPLPVDLTGVLIEINGKPAIVGYNHDLRPIKASMDRERDLENKLREQQMNERIQLIMDAGPICVTWYNAQRRMIDCNQEAVRLFGLGTKAHLVESFNTRFFDFFPAVQPNGTPSADMVTALFNEVEAHGRAQFEMVQLAASGENLPAQITLVRVDYDDSFMFVSYLTDLREAIAAEEKARDASELNQAMLDSSPYVIGQWDNKGQLLGGNTAQTTAFFKIDSTQRLVDDLFSFSPPLQPCGTPTPIKAAMYAEQAQRDGHVQFEWWHLIEGELVPVEVIYKMYKHKGEDMMFSYTFDLRERKRLEAERLEAMEESNRAKTRFLARMSHEIRTPITAVLGIAEVQLRSRTLTPQNEEVFARIYDASKTLLNIVNDILDLSRVESGKMPIINSEYDVAGLLHYTTQLQQHHANSETRDIALVLHVDPNLPTKLVGDALRVRQIITNLLTNAFKYTEAGSVTFSLSWEDTDNGLLIASIRDTGVGMSEEQVAQIKNEYMRFHEQDMPFVPGTGLGLPIVYNLAQAMDAQITLNSTVGHGTHITVRIPQKVADPQVLGPELAAKLQNLDSGGWGWLNTDDNNFTPTPMPHGRVMVVDDVDTNLYVAEAMLETFEVDITLCRSGQEAIEKVRQGHTYDIIFMDHMMPVMDGLQATQHLRDMGYTQPIVAFTANAVKGTAEMYKQHGFSGHMYKPIDIRILNSYLVRFVEKR